MKTMKYVVFATVITVGSDGGDAPVRSEVVDTESNELFSKCKDEKDIQEAYESFWNDLPTILREQVVVLRVVRAR